MSKQNKNDVEVTSENEENDREEEEYVRKEEELGKKKEESSDEIDRRHESSDEEDDSKEENFAVIPPNGGWGWVVVACAFYCNVVVDGIQLTFGVFLKNISDTFKVEYSVVALAGSLMFGVHLLMGPVCTGFSSIFGLRPVTITGSLICCFGVAITYFANCYWYLYLSYGVIGGIGLGLVYMNSLVITSLYFTTLLPIANAIVVCGTGVGTMVFAFFGSSLLRITTWQNSFLIQAALAGSMALAAISFKPLKPIRVKLSVSSELHPYWPPIEEEPVPRTSKKGAVFIKKHTNSRQSATSTRTIQSLAWSSLLEHLVVTEMKRKKRCQSECSKCKKKRPKEAEVLILSENKNEIAHGKRKSYVEKERSMSRTEDGFSVNLSASSQRRVFTKVEYEEKPHTKACDSLKKTIVAMLDFHLLSSFAFFLFTISGALQMASLIVVFIYEKDRCAEIGFTEEMSVYFVVTLGGANMVWRLLLGGLATIPKINYRALAVSTTVIGGLATMVSGLNSSIYYQFAFCVFFGLGMASFAVFRLVFLIELVGVELVGNATGINLLFMGVFCIASPPLFGWAMEVTKSYNVIFLSTGSFIVASGLMLIGLQKLRRKELEKRDKRRPLALDRFRMRTR